MLVKRKIVTNNLLIQEQTDTTPGVAINILEATDTTANNTTASTLSNYFGSPQASYCWKTKDTRTRTEILYIYKSVKRFLQGLDPITSYAFICLIEL